MSVLSIRSSKISRQMCRSPVFVRRPTNHFNTTDFDSTFQPIALLSLETNESNRVPSSKDSSSTVNTKKRPYESSGTDQILIKRRYHKSSSSKSHLIEILSIYC